MKRKRNVWEIICLTGAPWFFITVIAGIFLKRFWYTEYKRLSFEITSLSDIKEILLIAALIMLLIFVKNLMWLNSSKKIGLFTWLEKWKYEPPELSSRKRKAQYPDIDPDLLSDIPDGLVLGRKGKKFVRVPLKKGNILNAILMGSTGCGKSSLLLSMLIYQLHHKPKENENFSPMVFFALDIKPELAEKSCIIKGNQKVHVMNPLDRSTYGWDVYYRLRGSPTDDEIFSEMDLIARALIDAGKAEKNEFFYQSARNVATAILFYTFKLGQSFMQGIAFLLDGELENVVKLVIGWTEDKPEFRIVRKLLVPYAGKSGEAWQGIELSLRQAMAIFVRQNVAFFFDGNPRKASPVDLEKKVTVFFSIHENLLDEYKTILRLTTMQTLEHCKYRPETSHMLTLIIDEAARLGAINWTDFLATSRSHQISTILAFQGISQMQKVWGKEDAKTLTELCRVIEVLSCADPDMAKILSDWAGEYKEEKHSTNNIGKNDCSYSLSYEDKKILTQQDLLDLQDHKEAVAFVKGKYMRMDVEKVRYYNIPELNEISKRCLTINKEKSKEGGNAHGRTTEHQQ